MSETTIALSVGSASDVGRVRRDNEDTARVAGPVFVVADGMGGHAAGEVASRIAAETIAQSSPQGQGLQVRDLVDRVVEANRRILASAARHPEQTGMGTTATGLAVVSVGGSRHWAVFNVGDSRVYRLLDGRLSQVTVDHSEVWELVIRGELTPEQAQHHPGRNIVTRSLGREPMGPVDTWVFPPYAGESFLLCSDGLSNELTLGQMEAVLGAGHDAQETAEELVRRAVAAGGRDNVTAIVVASRGEQHSPDADEDTTPRDIASRSSGESST